MINNNEEILLGNFMTGEIKKFKEEAEEKIHSYIDSETDELVIKFVKESKSAK